MKIPADYGSEETTLFDYEPRVSYEQLQDLLRTGAAREDQGYVFNTRTGLSVRMSRWCKLRVRAQHDRRILKKHWLSTQNVFAFWAGLPFALARQVLNDLRIAALKNEIREAHRRRAVEARRETTLQ